MNDRFLDQKTIYVGLIINPFSGLGGTVGLKGSDGVADEALNLGAQKEAMTKAQKAIQVLLPLRDRIVILTASGDMGENVAAELGFDTRIIWNACDNSTFFDTEECLKAIIDAFINTFNELNAAESLNRPNGNNTKFSGQHGEQNAHLSAQRELLIMFAGGDGTARDICRTLNLYESDGEDESKLDITFIGIPAGVKIHSPVYGVNPGSAGKLALDVITKKKTRTRQAEVVDLDEDAYRAGKIRTSLYGYLRIPDDRDFMQHGKASSPITEKDEQRSIAHEMIKRLTPDTHYIVGPGTTTMTFMKELGIKGSLLGVDMFFITPDGKVSVSQDMTEKEILDRISFSVKDVKLIITPTGGQGYLLGRGNQQISSSILKRIGKEKIYILATREKLFNLGGRPLLVDTGDDETDRMLSGYSRAIIGFMEEQMVKIEAGR